ncbi:MULTISPECIES: hypothetical protein [unclassified Arthrobacter]|uniref:hypothetical protein n=1 Tax=unclassified Arthrobacter TaxID=235627 RepID=UPI001E3C603E|nr:MULTISPECIES: hypothetical protein [unclassified Arthrobacter]MCC9144691.1 hypothetical protein [Arthrobacter sp. zg-Y919]MDK1275917.1 hypothetical protein [Arthrobacter sp. zg.Y919]MDM7990224.1 hypothetical protein [Arthrobacter sp. zg-Y877]WIB02728.1 hypothetical protein QNO10_12370 [Arthrobacter sp. zg-Y919]
MVSEQHSPERREITVRRAPRFVPFLALGVVAGFIAALFVAYGGAENPGFTREATLGFFTMMFALPGLLLGALTALILDWISVRRARRSMVESVDSTEAQGPGQASS